MASTRLALAFIISSLLLNLRLAGAQTENPTPTNTFSGTTTLIVPLQSLYTDLDQPTTTFEYTTGTLTATETWDLYGGLQATDVAVGTGYTINNFSSESYAFCWYPTSGNWALLPRILFYITIVFALVARNYQWLIVGGLVGSLTFSGVAAIQVCAQIWSKQMAADLDLFPLTGILSSACIIAVPLMSWSSTIRHLGQSQEEKEARISGRHRYQGHTGQSPSLPPHARDDSSQDPSPSLTVIVFWAVLVAIGFMTAFVGLNDLRNDADYISLFVDSGASTIHCVPDSGILNLTAGQYPLWDYFWFNQEFAEANNCENPCQSVPTNSRTLFRSPGTDLVLLTAKSIDVMLEGTQISKREQAALKFTDFYFRYLLYGLPFIILQGLSHVLLFRRYSPQQARHYIYTSLVRLNNPGSTTTKLLSGFAFSLALTFYLLALLVLVVSPFAFIINIVATEIMMYNIPQSEANNHVGQWGVMASLILVLIAAFICRFEPGIKRYLNRAGKDSKKLVRHKSKRLPWNRKDFDDKELAPHPGMIRRKSSYLPDTELVRDFSRDVSHVILDTFSSLWYWLSNFFDMFRYEWQIFVQFWHSPMILPEPRVAPKKPISRRKQRKGSLGEGLPKSSQMANVASPQWDDEFKPHDNRYIELKKPATETHAYQAIEAERPLLSRANLEGSNPTVRRDRSVAFVRQNKDDSDRRNLETSPPVPAKEFRSRPRKPVPAVAIMSDEEYTTVDLSGQQISTGTIARDSSTVMGSLNDSIANRSRRSNVYSQGPGEEHHHPLSPGEQLGPRAKVLPTQHFNHTSTSDGLPSVSNDSEEDDLPPLPPPKTFNSSITSTSVTAGHPQLPVMSARSSHLFSEDELAQWYRNGTPRVRSAMPMPSRSSVVNSGDATTAAASDPAAPVRYLQIQTGHDFADSENWGDQVVLRRNRYGGWVVVDAGEENEAAY